MSLLMEALRKAEQAKLKAKEGGRETDPAVGRGEEENKVSTGELGHIEMETVDEASEPPLLSSSEPLTIETREEDELKEEVPVVSDAWEVTDLAGADSPGQLNEEPPSPSAPPPAAGDAAALEAPPPSPAKEVVPRADIPSAPPETSESIVPRLEISSGSIEASRRAAQSVFIAKDRQQRKVARQRVLVYAVLVLLALVGAGGYLYVSSQNIPMPWQPSQVATIAPPSEEPVKAETGDTAPPGFPAEKAAADPAKQSGPEKGQADSPATQPGAAAVVDTSPTLPATSYPTMVKKEESGPFAGSTAEADSFEPLRYEPQPLSVSGMEAKEPQSIRITKRSVVPQSDDLLVLANGDFRQGRYEQSRNRYQQLLKVEPGHRGALLGLAALSIRQNDPARARDIYIRLLTQNPSDPLAKAGLLSVMGNSDPSRAESELKLLLESSPELSPLHFLLGNFYAAGQRWNEAQQAYFNAVQAAGKNGDPSSDYLFNLAVSLEHLGQTAAAARYYLQALEQAGTRPAGFDTAVLRRRLLELQPEVGQ